MTRSCGISQVLQGGRQAPANSAGDGRDKRCLPVLRFFSACLAYQVPCQAVVPRRAPARSAPCSFHL